MFGHLGRNNLKRIISNCCAKGKTIILNDYRNIEEMVTGFFENLETEIVWCAVPQYLVSESIKRKVKVRI